MAIRTIRAKVWTAALLVAALSAGCQEQEIVARPAMTADAARPEAYGWRYDEAAPYFGMLPAEVQELVGPEPFPVANAVCTALGGRADFMQARLAGRERLGFNCYFIEPDMQTTVDFGELRRIQVTK